MLFRLVVFLIMLNILTVVAFLWKCIFTAPPSHPPPAGEDSRMNGNNRSLSGILENELNLSKEQSDKMQKMRDDFFKKENDLSAVIRSQRDSMNIEMFNKSTNEELVVSLAKRISENEHKMEMMRFGQSKAFKSICTQAQLEKFEKLVREIRDYFKPVKPQK